MSPRAWWASLLLSTALWTALIIGAVVLSGCSGDPRSPNNALLFTVVVIALLLCAGGVLFALLYRNSSSHQGEDDA